MRTKLTIGLAAAICFFNMAWTAARAQTITLWSHWADEQAKVAFVEEAARRFQQKNSGASVRITWYQKAALFGALQSAMRAGQGPDVFYLDPDRVEFIESRLLLPLEDMIDWNRIHDWARSVWTHGGKTYGLPLETQTVELYYNIAAMRRLGIELPPGKQLDQNQFLDLVKKSAAAGITPVVQGVGDRDFPGAYLTHELLLKKLGKDDYGRLLHGKLSYKDKRVVDVFTYVKQLVDAGAYPKGFASIKLGESHYYFHTKPGGLTFPLGSFYPGRAFNPPDKGGQPEDFELGIMAFPLPDAAACANCKTTAVGGSYVVNAGTKNPKLVGALLTEMTAPDMALQWLTTVLGAPGMTVEASQVTGKHAGYFKELAERNADAQYFVGLPIHHLTGTCLETYKQVMNTGFPGGLLPVDRAVGLMDQACYKG
jgi:multiple sugar transport system substrate-binding protein